MTRKIEFHSNSQLDAFTEHLDMRVASNLFEVDKDDRSVTFLIDPPHQVVQLGRDHSGEWVDED